MSMQYYYDVCDERDDRRRRRLDRLYMDKCSALKPKTRYVHLNITLFYHFPLSYGFLLSTTPTLLVLAHIICEVVFSPKELGRSIDVQSIKMNNIIWRVQKKNKR